MKIKTHQPNIRALIHNYANGVAKTMVSGNVSSLEDSDGVTRLITYSTTLAKRKVIGKNRNAVFLINSKNYSTSSNRHKNITLRAIPMPLQAWIPDRFKKEEWQQDFDDAERNFEEKIKEGCSVVIPYDGHCMNYGLTTVDNVSASVGRFLDTLENTRISKYNSANIFEEYGLLLRAKWLQRELNSELPKDEKKKSKVLEKTVRRFKRIAVAYMERIQKRTEEILRKAEERKRKAIAYVQGTLNNHGEAWRDICETVTERFLTQRNEWKAGRASLDDWKLLREDTRENAQLRAMWDEVSRRDPQLFTTSARFVFWLVKETTGKDLEELSNGEELRVNGNEVETSRGARVPEGIASRVFRRHAEELSKPRHVFTPPVQVGPFAMREVRDGRVIIGCHEIRQDGLLELAKERNW